MQFEGGREAEAKLILSAVLGTGGSLTSVTVSLSPIPHLYNADRNMAKPMDLLEIECSRSLANRTIC